MRSIRTRYKDGKTLPGVWSFVCSLHRERFRTYGWNVAPSDGALVRSSYRELGATGEEASLPASAYG